MRMLKVKYGKSTYQYRLDWIVCWNVLYNKQSDNNPENWEIALLFSNLNNSKLIRIKIVAASTLKWNLNLPPKQKQWPQFQ